MVKISLQLKANFENVTNLTAEGEDFRWFLKLKCLNCGETPDKWQYVTLSESNPLKGGRGSANMVSKCKMCGRENSIDILKDSVKPYSADNESFKTVVSFDCRGMEPTDFSPRIGWTCSGDESGTTFQDIDLGEKEWVDFDENSNQSVGIYELQHKFIKEK